MIGALVRRTCLIAVRRASAAPQHTLGTRLAHTSDEGPNSLKYHLMGTPHHRVPGLATVSSSSGGLVVLQEWWGINDQIKKSALRIADATGCQVVIPDLYRNKVAYEVAEAEHLLGELDWQKAIQDVSESALWLKAQGCKRVGVLGFCMGGALALGAGAAVPHIDASVCFYGWNRGLADMSRMCKPTQCHFGGKDSHTGFSDPSSAEELRAILEKSGCILEFYHYAGLGHGFMNGDTAWGLEMNQKLGRPPISEGTMSDAVDRVSKFLKKFIVNPPAPTHLQ